MYGGVAVTIRSRGHYNDALSATGCSATDNTVRKGACFNNKDVIRLARQVETTLEDQQRAFQLCKGQQQQQQQQKKTSTLSTAASPKTSDPVKRTPWQRARNVATYRRTLRGDAVTSATHSDAKGLTNEGWLGVEIMSTSIAIDGNDAFCDPWACGNEDGAELKNFGTTLENQQRALQVCKNQHEKRSTAFAAASPLGRAFGRNVGGEERDKQGARQKKRHLRIIKRRVKKRQENKKRNDRYKGRGQ